MKCHIQSHLISKCIIYRGIKLTNFNKIDILIMGSSKNSVSVTAGSPAGSIKIELIELFM